MKIIAELYDEGKKEVKILKSRENQSKEVENLPVSALFIGSQDNLLYDDNIKRKFKTEFTTKLARRSFFIFVNEELVKPQYSSVQELLEQEKHIEDTAIFNRHKVSEYIVDLTNELIDIASSVNLTVSNNTRDLFALYKRYNEEVSDTIDSQYPMAKLNRTHLQWKALKLSGALALLDYSNTIEVEHYKAAIEFIELINNDIGLFEKELVKEPYELFADYVRLYANHGEYSINLHNLRKLGFIPMRGTSSTQLLELVKLVNSYDEHGVYTTKNDIVYFKELEKTDKILLSYVKCTGSKQQRAANCSSGYQCEEVEFSDILEMLKDDYAFTPFRFVNGVRGGENIDSSCGWIVLDVDSSEITDEEAHVLLSDINHYVVRTSNKDNPNKFRVLLELDAKIDIASENWMQFIQLISNDIGIPCDKLSKAQIFFSYKDRNILYQFNGSPLHTKHYLQELTEYKESKPIPKKVANNMLQDPITTFERAFNAKDGEGRIKLIWAVKYARELGCTKEYAINLLKKITEHWVKGFPKHDLDIMIRQISRWSFNS